MDRQFSSSKPRILRDNVRYRTDFYDRWRHVFEVVVVVDNCPHGTARAIVDEFSKHSQLHFRYENELTPGVSAARNRGVARARGELIAFLDDDEDAEPGWFAALVAAQRASRSDAVFGAVLGQCDGLLRGHVELAEQS